jgi:hypothetical protein
MSSGQIKTIDIRPNTPEPSSIRKRSSAMQNIQRARKIKRKAKI